MLSSRIVGCCSPVCWQRSLLELLAISLYLISYDDDSQLSFVQRMTDPRSQQEELGTTFVWKVVVDGVSSHSKAERNFKRELPMTDRGP